MRPLGHRKGLAIGSLNINSLLLHIDEVSCFIKEKGFHIFALNKAKLEDTFADELLEIERYTLQREASNRHGVGVAVYVAESLKHHRGTDLPEGGFEIISLKLNPPELGQSVLWLGTDLLQTQFKSSLSLKET